jgi:hypothetical protein
MKPRHVAALALVGWYLMVPPLVPQLSEGEPYLGFLPLAPLSQWTILDSFDSAEECIDAHVKLLRDRVIKNVNDEIRLEQAYSARCIATDNPRLKKK